MLCATSLLTYHLPDVVEMLIDSDSIPTKYNIRLQQQWSEVSEWNGVSYLLHLHVFSITDSTNNNLCLWISIWKISWLLEDDSWNKLNILNEVYRRKCLQRMHFVTYQKNNYRKLQKVSIIYSITLVIKLQPVDKQTHPQALQ